MTPPGSEGGEPPRTAGAACGLPSPTLEPHREAELVQGLPGGPARWDPSDQLWVLSPEPRGWAGTVEQAAGTLPVRLASIWAEPDAGDGVILNAVLLARSPAHGIRVCSRLAPEARSLPSLAAVLPAATDFEREVAEEYAVEFTGTPDPRPLRAYAARTSGRRPASAPAAYPFPKVEGEGIHEIAVGPVHAGVIEPGHFRFQVVGEQVLDLEIQLGYTYKGTEALWVGQRPEDGLLWAESISGDHSVAGAVAYAQAVEAAQGLPVPAAAEAARGLLLEVERYAFHIGTVAGIALDVGYARGAAAGYRLRQRAHRCLDRLTGSRLGRGAVAVGGLRRPLTTAPAAVLVAELQSMSDGAIQIWEDLEAVASVVDRVRGTGEVSPAIARALQLVGPTGRASGIDHDVRRDRPYGIYRSWAVRVPTEARGDVEARLRLYALEAAEAGRLAARWVESASAAPGVGRIAPELRTEGAAHGLGVVESPRGEWLVRTVQDARGRLVRVHVREPSFLNWRALKYAARRAIVPDFPLCNKSFNLSYSGFDR